MGLKEDIDGHIDAIKTMADTTFPDLPSTRRKTAQVRAVFDAVTFSMKEINDMAADGLTEIEGDIAELGSSKADSSVVSALSSTLSALQTTVSGLATSKANQSSVTAIQATISGLTTDIANLSSNKQDKFTGTTSQYVRGDGSLATFPSTAAYTDEMAQDAVGSIMSASGGVAVSYNDAGNAINFSTPKTWSSPARSLNTVFQPSATRDTYCRYSVQITSAATLVLGSRGTVYLRYADNSGFTTNVVEVDRQSFGVGSGLVVTGTTTVSVGGPIPAGKFVQIITENTVATPSFAYQSALEVLI